MDKHLFVLYTGGTIGCASSACSPALVPLSVQAFAAYLADLPAFADSRLAAHPNIHYTIQGFEQPLDSANMTPTDWVRIARTLLENYEKFDGFVVLHGTDTLAWTASALSFLLPGLTKPVVVTGSQKPLFDSEGDAQRNLYDALCVAGSTRLNEVCVCFNRGVFRGNRVVKVDAQSFAAFNSPNFSVFGHLNLKNRVEFQEYTLPTSPEVQRLNHPTVQGRQLALLAQIEQGMPMRRVATFVLFPGVQATQLQSVLTPDVVGLILIVYGTGNAPTRPDFLRVLADARDRGVVCVAVTQALCGHVVLETYETGASLAQVGVIGGADLTVPAAFAKLTCLCAQHLTPERTRQLMKTPLAGEMMSATASSI